MERRTFLLKMKPDMDAGVFREALPRLEKAVCENGGTDFSLWQAEDMVFGYFEREEAVLPDPAGEALKAVLEGELKDHLTVISLLNMRLMYHSIHHPLVDKSEVKAHRVFLCRVKPGCMEEYRRRHQGLEELEAAALASGEKTEEDFESSNFTIWNGGDYICGYNEMAAVPDSGDTNNGGDEVWEKSMLQIMDWLTDDADRFSGEKHEKIRRIL